MRWLSHPFTARPAPLLPADHPEALRLCAGAVRRHLHLDWQEVDDWLRSPYLRCMVLRQAGRVETLLGATLHYPLRVPPGEPAGAVAWLRLACTDRFTGAEAALDPLWEALQADLRQAAVRQVALLAVEPWGEVLAKRWNFGRVNAVVTLQRTAGPVPPPPEPPLRIRPVAGDDDLTAVEWLDAGCFGPIWQYNRETLAVARAQAATFTLLERGDQPIGYQLSTRYLHSAHLARLAILPEEQGRGLGALLVGEMLRFFERQGITLITVNTQEDNHRSQRLYARLGFRRSGQGVPVWALDLRG